MIVTRVIDNTIRVNCTRNQVIDVSGLTRIYRLVLRLIKQHGNLPIIVDAEINVRLSKKAAKIFKQIDVELQDITLIIISG